MHPGRGEIMNVKGIKALRWHTKALIDTLTREGINVGYISERLDSIIDNLDAMRIENSDINEAYDRGFTIGYGIGYNKGNNEQSIAVESDYNNRIDIRGVTCGSVSYFDGFVDDTYAGSAETILECVDICKRVIKTEEEEEDAS